MPLPKDAIIWDARLPAAWPDVPSEMTVTTLLEIETCPRRWALLAAAYPELWSGRGYPPRVTLPALGGTVVHLALERITRALVEAGCGSVQDPAAVQVMRTLGGYTKIVNDCIQTVQARAATNPRALRVADFINRSLRAQVPDLRARTQRLLSSVRVPEVHLSRTQPRQTGRGAHRAPLAEGIYAELELRVPTLRWKGKADLLVITPASCEITDFKTGAPDQAHEFQLQVYALLWSRDSDLNPSGRRADRLNVTYSSGQREVAAPAEPRLKEVEHEVLARRDAAIRSVSHHPPEARPSSEHCGYCAARHLCGAYWDVQLKTHGQQQTDRRFGDLEVTVTGRHGPASWDAVAEVSGWLPHGKSVVLRTSDDLSLQRNQRLRILDAGITVDDDEAQPAVVTVGALTETYSVAAPA
jgi:hypothetical protein